MNEKPPPIPRVRSERQARVKRGKYLVQIWAALIPFWLIGAYFLNQTSWSSALPKCGLKTLTGLDCPGCGGTRSTAAILRFDLLDAFGFHAVWFLTAAYLMMVLCAETLLFVCGRSSRSWFPAKLLWIWLFAIVLLTILRNVPGLESLKP